jgi:hypothetical protein
MSGNSNQGFKNWRVETDASQIVWLCIDKADSSANVLSGPVLQELAAIIEPFRVAPPAGIVFHSGKQNGFVMGADINEFSTIKAPDEAYKLIRLGQQVRESMVSHLAVASNWHWPAITGLRSGTTNRYSGCPKYNSASTPDSVERCARSASVAFVLPCS